MTLQLHDCCHTIEEASKLLDIIAKNFIRTEDGDRKAQDPYRDGIADEVIAENGHFLRHSEKPHQIDVFYKQTLVLPGRLWNSVDIKCAKIKYFSITSADIHVPEKERQTIQKNVFKPIPQRCNQYLDELKKRVEIQRLYLETFDTTKICVIPPKITASPVTIDASPATITPNPSTITASPSTIESNPAKTNIIPKEINDLSLKEINDLASIKEFSPVKKIPSSTLAKCSTTADELKSCLLERRKQIKEDDISEESDSEYSYDYYNYNDSSIFSESSETDESSETSESSETDESSESDETSESSETDESNTSNDCGSTDSDDEMPDYIPEIDYSEDSFEIIIHRRASTGSLDLPDVPLSPIRPLPPLPLPLCKPKWL